MSLGLRLKEERHRLKLNQTDFAAIADASKAALINWEKDVNSPPATALIAFGEAGADMLYILTGQRSAEEPSDVLTAALQQQLDDIQRELLNATIEMKDENAESIPRLKAGQLASMLENDAQFMTREMVDRAMSLLDIATDPEKLAAFHAVDHRRTRKKREEIKKHLAIYIDDCPYVPSASVRDLLTVLALDYGAPIGVLADLIFTIGTDIGSRLESGEPIGTSGDL